MQNNKFYGAFADVTGILNNFGNGTYTVSNFDLTGNIFPGSPYCNNQTDFGGWTITVVYQDNSLPLNQVNLFDGFESVSQFNNNLTIQLTTLNVMDNMGAKIGFLAWEGDASLAVNETLRINGNILSNPPLNPARLMRLTGLIVLLIQVSFTIWILISIILKIISNLVT